MKVEYPKWIYRGGESRLVESREEHDKFSGWFESPKRDDDQTEPKRRGRPPKAMSHDYSN